MDPISLSASVLTILAAAGGSCKFLYNLTLDITDAPTEIRAQAAQLGCLYSTITGLIQIYRELPHDAQVDQHLCGSIARFTDEIGIIKAKLEAQEARLGHGRMQRMRERCKWLMSDRQLRKFFDSLENWNIVFSQAVSASQLLLLRNIAKQTSSLVASPRQPSWEYSVNAESGPVTKPRETKKAALCYGHVSCINAQSDLLRDELLPSPFTKRLSNYLSTVRDPVGLEVRHRHRIILPGLSIEFESGPTIVRRWSESGRAAYTVLSASEGYSSSLRIQGNQFIPARLSIDYFSLYKLLCFPRLSTHFNLRMTAVIPLNIPSLKAIEIGDIAYLRHQLISREVGIFDTTPGGNTLLHSAARHSRQDIIAMLVEAGADVNATNDSGQTPLHISIKFGKDYDCARQLLIMGADVCLPDGNGRTALHTFYNETVKQILHYHMEELDTWIQDREGMTLMHWVSWSSKPSSQDIARQSNLNHSPNDRQFTTVAHLEIKDAQGRSMLHFAAQRGNLDLIDFLFQHPQASTLMLPDHLGRTLLHYATESSRINTIDFLIQRNFDLHATDSLGRTVLHYAAMKGSLSAVKRLLDLGAGSQLACLDREQRTPLEAAKACGSKMVFEYLQPMYQSGITRSFVDVKWAEGLNPGEELASNWWVESWSGKIPLVRRR